MNALRMLAISDAPLSVSEVYQSVSDEPAAGGIALFVGVVRNEDDGRDVTALGYSAHPSAIVRMREVIDGATDKFPIKAVSAVHRVGDLAVGDIAVIVAVACPKRAEAFAACHLIVDRIKEIVPIWKNQTFTDGDSEWVGAEG